MPRVKRTVVNPASSKTSQCLVYTIFFISVGLLVRYWFYFAKFQLNSDAYTAEALANSIQEHKSIFPSEFAYPNGDSLFFYHHIFVLFFKNFIQSPNLVHSCASLVIGTMFLGSVYFFTTALGASHQRSLLIVSFLATGISLPITDWIFGQAGYSILIMFILIFLAQTHKLFERVGFSGITKLRFRELFLFLPIGFLFIANPLRLITSILIPIALVLIYMSNQLDSTYNWIKKLIKLNLGRGLMFMTPFFATRLFFEINTTSPNGIASTGFRSVDNFLEGPRNTILGVIELFQLLPEANTGFSDIQGVIALFRIMLFILCVVAFRQFYKSKRNILRNDVIFLTLLVGLIFHIFLLSVTNISIDTGSGRYLLSYLLILLLVLLARSDFDFDLKGRLGKSIIISLLVIVGTSNIYNYSNLDKYDYSKRVNLVKFIRASEITQVNATFWQSAKNQMVSENRVQFFTIKIDEPNCIAEYWWLNDIKPIDRSLPLILTRPEYDYLESLPACSNYFENATKSEFEDYIILKVPKNG
jgi:hypothetical protein